MKTLLLILAALPAFAQQSISYIASTGAVSLSSAATVATLQQPTTGSTAVTFPANPSPGATIYCSAACVATLYRSGAAATTTAATANPVNQSQPASSVLFFTASDGGTSGAVTLAVFNIAAGETRNVDLSQFTLGATNLGTTNLSIGIASVTATVNITFFPKEVH